MINSLAQQGANHCASYAGQFGGAPGGPITFIDAQGIQYNFPLRDVQSHTIRIVSAPQG